MLPDPIAAKLYGSDTKILTKFGIALLSGFRDVFLRSKGEVVREWRSVAATFCGDWNLMGVDLMNEPHMGFWGGVGGTKFDDSDWSVGAATLGNAVLAVCPRLLIFVEGTAE